MANLVSPFTIDPVQSATGFISPNFIVDQNGNLSTNGNIVLTTGNIVSGATVLLSNSGLGPAITSSYLTTLGTLSQLIVNGTSTISGTVYINSNSTTGTMDNVTIGSTTPKAGTFTTVEITQTIAFNPTTEGTIDNVAVGNTNPSTGNFTTMTSTNASVSGTMAVAGKLTVGGVNITSLSLAFAAALG
jgi:hypothetical protein